MSRSPVIGRLIFFHLGRTGGTTMRKEILYKCADPATIFYVGGAEPPVRGGTAEDLLNMPRKEQEKLRVIVGHMPFGLREHLPWPETWHYATLLREPVARTVSDYYQVRNNPTNPCHANGMRYSLQEFVRRRCGLSWNGICRWLSNETFGEKFESSDAMLEQAIRNAEACSFVGLTEFYDESVRELCWLCGWKAPRYKKCHSLTPKGHTLSASEQELLHANTLLDQVIHARFRNRFLQQQKESHLIPMPQAGNLLSRLWPFQRRDSAA